MFISKTLIRLIGLVIVLAAAVFVNLYAQEREWLWAEKIEIDGEDDSFYGPLPSTLDDEGNLYIAGSFMGIASFGEIQLQSEGRLDIFVAKLNNTGEWEWAVRAGGTDLCRVGDITLDSDVNIYIVGHFFGSINFGETQLGGDYYEGTFAAKLRNDGDWRWVREVQGNIRSPYIHGIVSDDEDNLYVTGIFWRNVIFGDIILNIEGGWRIFVAKIDTRGEWQWAVNTDGYGFHRSDVITVDNDNNIYIAGLFNNEIIFGDMVLVNDARLAQYDLFAVKLDREGEWQWAKIVGGDVNNQEIESFAFATSIAVDNDDNFYLTGVFKGIVYFGEIELISSSPDNIIYRRDPFVAKIDSEGEWEWAIPDEGFWPSDISLDNAGYGYITGGYRHASFGEIELISDVRDAFFAKIDSRGVWQWAKGTENTDFCAGLNILPYDNGTIYLTGYFENEAVFGETVLQSTTERNFFAAKLGVLFPYPSAAKEPIPADDSVDVSVDLSRLSWSYEAADNYTDPAGFRVYLNDTGEFDDEDDFVWVPYIEEQVEYNSAEILPEQLEYKTTYFWKVVPTTRENGIGEGYDAQDIPVWSFTTELYPNPVVAVNPYPSDDSIGVSVDLEELNWDYIGDEAYTNPLGFRVYFNDTGEFDDQDEFVWVPYIEEQVEYDCAEILPEQLDYKTTYYWKVIPTTKEEGTGEGEDAVDVPVWSFITGEPVSVEDEMLPAVTELRRNYPNPFNPDTIIEFSLKEEAEVRIVVYNLKGHMVRTLQDGIMKAGNHRLHWDGTDNRGRSLSSGVYLYRMTAGDYDKTNRMILVK